MTHHDSFAVILVMSMLMLVLAGNTWWVMDSHDRQEEQIVRLRSEITQLKGQLEATSDSLNHLSSVYSNDKLWLTRAILSETKRPEEFDEVATVIRNRVKVGYRGKTTYEGVVRDPWQFTAIGGGPGYQRTRYLTMTAENTPFPDLWRKAHRVATRVMHADAHELPLNTCVIKFYSPQSMEPMWSKPRWIYQYDEVHSTLKQQRFRFYGTQC
jgi:spore germination cell wall hydrolase CwlJ-like protein